MAEAICVLKKAVVKCFTKYLYQGVVLSKIGNGFCD